MNLRVESANRAFYRIFRVAPAETIGKMIYDLGNHQWDIPRLRELLEEILLQSATIEDFQVEHDFDALGRRTMLLNARRIQTPDPLGESQRILVAIADVTERKHAELALSTLASIVEFSDDPIISKTLDGIITSWNRSAETMFGFTAVEAVGQHISLIVPEELRSEEAEILARLRRGEKIQHFETERQTKDGRRVSVSLTISPIRNVAGEIIGASKVARDITERKRLEEELKQYSADLSEAADRRNEFLAMLGHELRNPLSALAHGLEFLGKVQHDYARSEALRSMMVRQTERIGALLDQLLDISRVISGKVELSKRRVDLREVVRAAVETAEPLIAGQRHELTVTLPSETSAFVSGDAVRLTQIVENLVTNAAKYTNEGGKIAVSLEPSEGSVQIVVSDNGTGIDAELLPHIFEVFTQGPRTLDRAKGGLGLGLPLVRRLVEMHGGQVSASSAGLGRGSAFVVTLPRVLETHSAERVEREKCDRPPADPGKVRPHRILVVDDEEDMAELLAALLETEGHQTLALSGGMAALSAVLTFDPEVVLLDLGLPDMDGYEVARRLREKLGDKRVLLIAVTGYQNDPARLMQAGFDGHVIKPTSVKELSALLAARDSGKGVSDERA